MSKFVPYALGAAAVVVALVVGIQFLRLAEPSGPAAVPSAQLSAMPSPTPSTALSASPAASIPPLTQTFTSPLHGFSVSYPEGWLARAATEPWTDGPSSHSVDLAIDDPQPDADHLYDPILTDHLFLTMTSQPIGDATPTSGWPRKWRAKMHGNRADRRGRGVRTDRVRGLRPRGRHNRWPRLPDHPPKV